MDKTLFFGIVVLSSILTVSASDGREFAVATLECTTSSMNLTLNKTQIDSRGRDYKIFFYDQESDVNCMILANTTNVYDGEIWLAADYNDCGINIVSSGTDLIYNQTIVINYGENPNSNLIFREENDYYHVKCTKSGNMSVNIAGESITVTKMEKTVEKSDKAEFDVTLKRFESNAYGSAQDTSGTVRLGDPLFFKLKLSTDRRDLKMQPQNCYATATPGSAARHYLIKDRCADAGDGTVKLPSFAPQVMDTSHFSWSNQAFRFFGSSANIYIVCDVLICLKTDTSLSCEKCGGPARKRRDVFALDTDEGRKMSKKVTAPLIVILDDNQSSGQSTGNSNVFSGTQGTIILVLLIALALVALALIVKKLVAPVRSNAPVAITNVETGFENKGMDKI